MFLEFTNQTALQQITELVKPDHKKMVLFGRFRDFGSLLICKLKIYLLVCKTAFGIETGLDSTGQDKT